MATQPIVVPGAMTTQEEDNAPWRTVDNYDPDEAWAVIGPEQEFIVDTERGVIADSMAAARGTQGDLPVACWTLSVDELPAKRDGYVRFVCVSDTHNLHDRVRLPEDGDVLLHAGDFTSTGRMREVKAFGEWLDTVPYKHKVVIAGNHDTSLDPASYKRNWRRFRHKQQWEYEDVKREVAERSTYLEEESCELFGYKIFGSPWQPEFCDWGFNAVRGSECREKWDKIPDDTDLLITHGPPLGRGDQCFPARNLAGCVDLLEAIQGRIKPLVHVFGHIHEGFGVSSDGTTTYVNASTCTLRYRADNLPVVFDLPIRKNEAADEDESGASEAAPSASAGQVEG